MAEVIDTRELQDEMDELEMFGEDRDIEQDARFQELTDLADEIGGEFSYGEQMIPVGDWIEYVEELIDDCYEIPTGTDWPMRHMKLDYRAAADELLADYIQVTWEGAGYYVRSA